MQAAPDEPKPKVEWGRSTASDVRAQDGEAAGSARNAASNLPDHTPALGIPETGSAGGRVVSGAALVQPQGEGRACLHSSTFLAGRAVVPASAQEQVDGPGAPPGATIGVPAVVPAAAVSAARGGASAGGAGACRSVMQRHLPADTPPQRSKPTLRVTDVTSAPPPLTPMSYTPRRTQLDDRTLQYLMSKWGGRAQQLELVRPGPGPPVGGAACSDASGAVARPSQGSDAKLQTPEAAASGHRTGPTLTGTKVDAPRVAPEEGPADSDATAGDRTKTETPEATQRGGHGTHGSRLGRHGRVRSPALAGDRTMTDSPEVGGLLAAASPGRGCTGGAASSEKKPSRKACTASQTRAVGSPGVSHAASRASGDRVAPTGETSRGPTPASAPGMWADSCEHPSPAAASPASPASRAEGGNRGEFSTPGPMLAPAQEADDDTENNDAESQKSLALGDINTRLNSVDSRASRRGESVAASTGSRAAGGAADISGFNMDRYEGESSVSTECPEIRESLMANSPESRGGWPTSSSSARSVGSWRRTIEAESPDGTPSLPFSQGASPHGDAHDSSACHSPIRPYLSDQLVASPEPQRPLSTETLGAEASSRNGARTASRAEAPQGGERALEEGEQAAPATLIHVNAQELTFLQARPEGEGRCEQVLLVRNESPGPVALSYTCLGEDMASSSPAFKVCGSMLDAAPILAPGQTSTLTVSCDASAFPRSATAAGAEDAGEAPAGNGGVLAIVAMAVSEMHKAGVRGSTGEAFCQHVGLRFLPPLPGARPSSTSSPQPAPSPPAASSAAVASTRCIHTTAPATLGPEMPAEGSRRSTPNAGVLPDTPKQPTETCPSRDSPGARTAELSQSEPCDDAAACPGAAMHGSAAEVERADKTAVQRGALGAVDGECLAVPAATHCVGAAEVPADRRGAGGAVEGDMWFVDVSGVDLGRVYIQDRNQCILGGTECGADDGTARGVFSVVNPSGVDLHFHVRVIPPVASSASSPAFVVASAGADVQQASASLVLTVPARHSRQLRVGIDARAYDFSGCVCCRGELSVSTIAHPHDLTALLNPPGCHALNDAAGHQRAEVVGAGSASIGLACEVGFCRLQVAGEVEEVLVGCCRGDQAQHVIGN